MITWEASRRYLACRTKCIACRNYYFFFLLLLTLNFLCKILSIFIFPFKNYCFTKQQGVQVCNVCCYCLKLFTYPDLDSKKENFMLPHLYSMISLPDCQCYSIFLKQLSQGKKSLQGRLLLLYKTFLGFGKVEFTWKKRAFSVIPRDEGYHFCDAHRSCLRNAD